MKVLDLLNKLWYRNNNYAYYVMWKNIVLKNEILCFFSFQYSWHRLREQQQQEKEAKQQADEAKKNKKKTKRKNKE